MLILFGTRRQATVVALVSFVCRFCSKDVPQRVLRVVNRFTLFFVPLFPVSTRFANECSNCGGTTDISREQADSAIAWAQANR
ncbi:zinc ribbon family protein [Labedella gwakjiensis]|uniref:Zinc ribbon family protein n=1 Tax=Labedella gwakjiensis TaxID=390269 RepID=A0A2P8GX08_9MICO|nr:zinc-ribbon domain-containing protein [Labedella gwakjiensis]PSL38498.1 zinc ribbon family protein [Labedella gwakjiensis]RUQ86987.1 zinc-ribbon domain-containing protein [Labedella gwakjiensis]